MKMTTKEAAQYLGVTIGFVSRLCKQGIIQADKFGRDWSIDQSSVIAYKQRTPGKAGRPRKSKAPQ